MTSEEKYLQVIKGAYGVLIDDSMDPESAADQAATLLGTVLSTIERQQIKHLVEQRAKARAREREMSILEKHERELESQLA